MFRFCCLKRIKQSTREYGSKEERRLQQWRWKQQHEDNENIFVRSESDKGCQFKFRGQDSDFYNCKQTINFNSTADNTTGATRTRTIDTIAAARTKAVDTTGATRTWAVDTTTAARTRTIDTTAAARTRAVEARARSEKVDARTTSVE